MMRTLMSALGAISLAVPVTAALPAAKAEAKAVEYKDTQKRQKGHAYREWRGRDGRLYCRKPNGTTGLVVGAAAGALVGRSVDTRGERATGTILGAVVGGLAGREIDRNNSRRRCR